MLRFLTFLSALFFASAAAATTLWVDAPKDGYLNLRSGPSTRHEVVRQMPHGTRVEVLKTPGDWYRVRHASGAKGWAHSKFLSAQKATGHDRGRRYGDQRDHPRYDGHKTQDYWIHAPGYSGLNLRNGPGTGFPVLLTMQQGEKVVGLGRQGGWVLLRHKSGKVGWAHADYLVDKNPRRKGGFDDRYPDRGGVRKVGRIADAIDICAQRPQHRLRRCMYRQLDLGGHPARNW